MNRVKLIQLTQTRLFRTLKRQKPVKPSIDEQLANFDEKTRKSAKDGLEEHIRTNGKPAPVDLSKLNEVALLQKINGTQNLQSLESDSEFWNVCKQFCKQADAKEHMSTLASLFQAAKSITDKKMRMEYLYIVGKALYAPRMVRLDPVNEIEFLDALCVNSRVYTALKLWKSRLGREDVAGLKWYWLEVGILYYLQANLYLPAARLASQIPARYGYMPPRVIASLISFQCSSKFPNYRAIESLIAKLTAGEYTPTSAKNTLQTHGSTVSVNKLKVSREEYILVLKSLIAANLWQFASTVYKRCLSIGIHPRIADLEPELKLSARKAGLNDGFVEFYDLVEDSLLVEPAFTGRLILSTAVDSDISAVPGIYEKLVNIPSEFLPAITLRLSRHVGPEKWPKDVRVLHTVLKSSAISNDQKHEYVNAYLAANGVTNLPAADFGLLVMNNYIELLKAADLAADNTQFWKYVWYKALELTDTTNTNELPLLFARMQQSKAVITPQLALYMIYAMQRINEGKQALLFATERGFIMSKLQFMQLKKGAKLAPPISEPDLRPPVKERRVSLRRVEQFLEKR